MPNTKSATKAMRQSRKRHGVNQKTGDKYKKALRDFRKLITASKLEDAKKALAATASALDKAVKKHLIHGNKASRLKSRMAKALGKLK
ncbi:MAG: 30S ribosomal protein S20 [Patescibacteria group bacterium]|nr:30S ribosomal protein S20 [Patescibacteria group bacterium]